MNGRRSGAQILADLERDGIITIINDSEEQEMDIDDPEFCPLCRWSGAHAEGCEVLDFVRHFDPAYDCDDYGCGWCHEESEIRRDWLGIEGVTLYYVAMSRPDTSFCPIHGEQEVIGYGSTGGPDPYYIDKLACGHRTVGYGPGDDSVEILNLSEEERTELQRRRQEQAWEARTEGMNR